MKTESRMNTIFNRIDETQTLLRDVVRISRKLEAAKKEFSSAPLVGVYEGEMEATALLSACNALIAARDALRTLQSVQENIMFGLEGEGEQ